MSRVIKPLVCLVALLCAAYLVRTFVVRPARPAPPALPGAPGLDPAERGALVRASHLEAPALFRQAIDRAASPAARAEIEALYASRAQEAADALASDIEELRAAHRYEEAVRSATKYASAWSGTSLVARAEALRADLRAEQEEQVARRGDEAMTLLDEGRIEGAREALRTSWQLEAPYAEDLRQRAEALERLIRVREHEAARGPAAAGPPSAKPPAAATPGAPPPPPPRPGAPPPPRPRRPAPPPRPPLSRARRTPT